MLIDIFQIKRGSVLSFVGAGGKTSLIYLLTREFLNLKVKVLVTTTTSLFNPSFDLFNYDCLLFGNLVNLKFFFYKLKGIFFAAKKYDIKKNKLIGYSPKEIDLISKIGIFDYIFVEADGSNMKSAKIHGTWEPVVPITSSVLIGCISSDFLEKIIMKFFHRSNFFFKFSSDNKSVNKNNLLYSIFSNFGLFKNTKYVLKKIIVLNKSDNNLLIKKGIDIIKISNKLQLNSCNLLVMSLLFDENFFFFLY